MTEYARGVIEGYLKGYNACKQDLGNNGQTVNMEKVEELYNYMIDHSIRHDGIDGYRLGLSAMYKGIKSIALVCNEEVE